MAHCPPNRAWDVQSHEFDYCETLGDDANGSQAWYMYVHVYSKAGGPVTFGASPEKGKTRIWINGQATQATEKGRVELKPGWNSLLVKSGVFRSLAVCTLGSSLFCPLNTRLITSSG